MLNGIINENNSNALRALLIYTFTIFSVLNFNSPFNKANGKNSLKLPKPGFMNYVQLSRTYTLSQTQTLLNDWVLKCCEWWAFVDFNVQCRAIHMYIKGPFHLWIGCVSAYTFQLTFSLRSLCDFFSFGIDAISREQRSSCWNKVETSVRPNIQRPSRSLFEVLLTTIFDWIF